MQRLDDDQRTQHDRVVLAQERMKVEMTIRKQRYEHNRKEQGLEENWITRFLNDDLAREDGEIEALWREVLMCDESHKEKAMDRMIDALKEKYK